MSQDDAQDAAQGQPADGAFIPPSVDVASIATGDSYTYHTPVPEVVAQEPRTPCVLGVDEAGRGPVLGPMVYGVLYLPLAQHRALLADTHGFDDSKVLTPAVRTALLQKLCTPATDLFQSCGWATRALSARDIAAGMLQPAGNANLNRQAADATIELIQGVLDRGVVLSEIYVDALGPIHTYQARLERLFPQAKVTVAKKADSLYPCVSAASVCAKVTRDAALDVARLGMDREYRATTGREPAASWGSGYPSDARAVTWLRANMDPFFGWAGECRFSWGTAKDMLEAHGVAVEWPEPEDQETARVTDFFSAGDDDKADELAGWYGRPATGLC